VAVVDPLVVDLATKRGYRAFNPATDTLPGGGAGGAIDYFNIPITSTLNVSGGFVDATSGGYTVPTGKGGTWMIWFEGWYAGTNANSKAEFGIAVNNPAAPSADTIRRAEQDSANDPLYLGSTAVFVSVSDGSTFYGCVKDIAGGTINVQARRLMGIRLSS